MMNELESQDFSNNLDDVMKSVCDSHTPMIVVNNGRRMVVIAEHDFGIIYNSVFRDLIEEGVRE